MAEESDWDGVTVEVTHLDSDAEFLESMLFDDLDPEDVDEIRGWMSASARNPDEPAYEIQEVRLTRDPASGSVVLSQRWDDDMPPVTSTDAKLLSRLDEFD